MVSLDALLEDGLLSPENLEQRPAFPDESVDYGAVIPWKRDLLSKAFQGFRDGEGGEVQSELDAFRARLEHD